MDPTQSVNEGEKLDTGPHFVEESASEAVAAWEQLGTGRFMPRRIRGSFKGRALG